ncbi:MAG TPA: transglutaminaseTgpA domain-containing protein [Thermoanaerobaculia bacterium]|nr:transglutaminaseTgpA domain-containing protein [Thermoanaerobaculia bacterium]
MQNDTRRELESLLLAAFAATPLYLTAAVGYVSLLLFHGAMAAIIFRVRRGQDPALLPSAVMRGLAVAFVPFYLIDAVAISRGAFAASTHLVFFIAVYQASESRIAPNHAQRLLTTAMIFIASIATSTHLTVMLFVIAFAFLFFRELMHLSHLETVATVRREYPEAPSARPAAFYLCGTTLVGILLFPLLPRVRNPFVQGMAGALSNATTGLSSTIDFNRERESPNDASVVARVWMGREAIPFFTPLRLRGTVYDRYADNVWLESGGYRAPARERRNGYQIAQPAGFARGARVQQRLLRGSRLFLPTGTYLIRGLDHVYEGPARGAYSTYQLRRGLVNYEVVMAMNVVPLRRERVRLVDYPVLPEVSQLARQIVGDSTKPIAQAAKIEAYLSRNFQYLPLAQQVGRTMNVDEFLLRERKGHCEYFAAGMVALLTALEVPSRIVGGFYGGQLNPLTGYFIVRKEDAHAWVEVWDGGRWISFDPTPTSLRPGNAQSGLLSIYATALSDSINYFWDRYILTYGLADQMALAFDLLARVRQAMQETSRRATGLGEVATAPAFLISVLAIGLVAVLIIALLRRRRSAFHLLEEYFRSIGIVVGPSRTVEEAVEELRRRDAAAAEALLPLVRLYEAESFSRRPDRKRVQVLRRRLTEMSR